MEELNKNGVWWLPDKPTKQVGGALEYSPKLGASLKITPPFANNVVIALSDVSKSINVIHGEINSKPVTLYDSWISGVHGNTQTIRSRYVFLGAHLTEEQCVFRKIKVSFTYLPEFCNHSGLSGSLQTKQLSSSLREMLGQEEQTIHEASIKVSSQEPIEIGNYNGDKYSIQYGWKQSSEHLRSMTVAETCHMVIDLAEPLAIESLFRDKVQPMRQLVTLAVNEQNDTTELVLENPEVVDHRNKPIKIKVLLQVDIKKPAKRSPFIGYNMLFQLKDIDETKLNTWLEVTKKYNPVVNIVFGHFYSSSSGLENGLLNTVTAAEAYHQRRFGSTIKPEDEWQIRMGNIVDALKEAKVLNRSDLNKVKQSLKFLNQKELAVRLKEILKHSTQQPRIPDIDWWSREIAGYRNSLTHYNPKHPKLVDYKDEKTIWLIFYLTRSLSLALLCCLMLDIGFSADEVREATKDKSNFSIVFNKLKEAHAYVDDSR